jgi:hypothetical protein
MPTGKIKMFNEDSVPLNRTTAAVTFSFTSQHCETAKKSAKAKRSALKWASIRSPGSLRPSASIWYDEAAGERGQ